MIDWKALLAKYAEERRCAACDERKQKAGFTVGQWRRAEEERICRECSHRRAAAGTPWQCNVCKLWQPEKAFSERHQHNRCSFYRVCRTCETRKPCDLCGQKRLEKDFSAAAWKARHASRRICKQCTSKARDHWTCTNCGVPKHKTEFHIFTQSNKEQNGRQTCDRCVQLVVACTAAAKANARLARTRRKCQEQRKNKVLAEVQAQIARIVAARKQGRHTVETKMCSEQTDRSSAPHSKVSASKMQGKAQQPTADKETCMERLEKRWEKQILSLLQKDCRTVWGRAPQSRDAKPDPRKIVEKEWQKETRSRVQRDCRSVRVWGQAPQSRNAGMHEESGAILRKGAAEPPSKGLQERQERFRAGAQSRDAKRHPRNALR